MTNRNFASFVVAATLLLAAAPARGAKERVTIEVAPAVVALAPGARAKLHVEAPERPAISANVGQVESIREIGTGVYEATYVPPAETFPQVAIIVATTSRQYAWCTLPLAGTGEVAVQTRPNANASLTIGGVRFGPVRADAAGRALIRVVVPPGETHALHGSRRVSLGTPAVSHVHVTVDRVVVGPGPTDVTVRAFAVTRDGQRRRGAALELSPSVGKLSPMREVAPGTFEAQWTIPAGDPGTLSLSARLKDERSSTSMVSVVRDRPRARRIEIGSERASVMVGADPLGFWFTVGDEAGNPVERVPAVTVRGGTLLGLNRGALGRWTGLISIPETLEGAPLEIVATVGDAVGRHTVEIRPGPAADVSLDPAWMDATDRDSISFTCKTIDRFGNPTDATTPEVAATLGRAALARKQGVGLYSIAYNVPKDRTRPTDVITVRAGSAEGVARIQLYLPPPSLFEITPKVGMALRSGSVGPAAGVEASAWTRLAGQEFGLAVEGTWFRFSNAAPIPNTPFSLDGRQTYLAFTASPSWRRSLGSSARLWASIGGGAVRVQSSAQLSSQPWIEESRWVAAGAAAVSIGAHMWGGFPFVELRGAYVADPKLSSLSGSFTPLFLNAGYRFDAF